MTPPGSAVATLRDGSPVLLRAVEPEDRERLIELYRDLSPDSRRLRFFSLGINVGRTVDRLMEGGPGLLALRGDRVLGHATYGVDEPGEPGEVAFVVADEAQGLGVGTLLLERIAELAHERGVDAFEARVLPENHRMLGVFRESGFPLTTRSEPGEVVAEFPTQVSAEGIARFERRERLAAAAGIAHVLRPASVAVLGAVARSATVGGEVVRNLLQAGFTGRVHLVAPRGEALAGLPAHRSLAEVADDVELAVLAGPADDVLDDARACAAHGVKALVVLPAGFAEAGEEGAARQEELLAICRAGGMRLVGPNCIGVLNADPGVRLNATFAPHPPAPGRVALFSQSGALGVAAMELAAELGVGLSSFVSMGNKADISTNDLLQFGEEDAATGVVLVYVESFGNPRRFARICRRVAREKPIVAVKSGRSAAAARATSTHTGALLDASDVTVDALFRQAGVVRVETVEELVEVGAVLAREGAPAGPRVGIVTNAGGLGVLCVDACVAGGLDVPDPSPVRLPGDATPEDVAEATGALVEGGTVDAVIPIFGRALAGTGEDAVAVLGALAGCGPGRVPVVPVVVGAGAARPGSLVLRTPERAARALAHAWRHRAWRDAPRGTVPAFADVDGDAAAALCAAALGRGGGWFSAAEAAELLGCYGISVAGSPAHPGAELTAGVLHDPNFGPVVACGAGGPNAELLRDVQVRLSPLTDVDAAGMLRALRSFPLLEGYGGGPAADVGAVEDLLLRVGALADAHPEVAELDLAPVVAGPEGCSVAGARVRVAAPVGPPRRPSRPPARS